MDKVEYRELLRSIKNKYLKQDYEGVIEVADQLDLEKVKENSILEIVAKAYEVLGRCDLARETLLIAYQRTPTGKRIAYNLAMLCIKLDDLDSAVMFYEDFCKMAPRDNQRLLLKYEIGKAGGVPVKNLAKVLEKYNSREMDDRWEYELARLYHEMGDDDKCAAACDQIILWYANGEYEKKALELKNMHKALNPVQQARYEEIMQNVLSGKPANGAGGEDYEIEQALEIRPIDPEAAEKEAAEPSAEEFFAKDKTDAAEEVSVSKDGEIPVSEAASQVVRPQLPFAEEDAQSEEDTADTEETVSGEDTVTAEETASAEEPAQDADETKQETAQESEEQEETESEPKAELDQRVVKKIGAEATVSSLAATVTRPSLGRKGLDATLAGSRSTPIKQQIISVMDKDANPVSAVFGGVTLQDRPSLPEEEPDTVPPVAETINETAEELSEEASAAEETVSEERASEEAVTEQTLQNEPAAEEEAAADTEQAEDAEQAEAMTADEPQEPLPEIDYETEHLDPEAFDKSKEETKDEEALPGQMSLFSMFEAFKNQTIEDREQMNKIGEDRAAQIFAEVNSTHDSSILDQFNDEEFENESVDEVIEPEVPLLSREDMIEPVDDGGVDLGERPAEFDFEKEDTYYESRHSRELSVDATQYIPTDEIQARLAQEGYRDEEDEEPVQIPDDEEPDFEEIEDEPSEAVTADDFEPGRELTSAEKAIIAFETSRRLQENQEGVTENSGFDMNDLMSMIEPETEPVPEEDSTEEAPEAIPEEDAVPEEIMEESEAAEEITAGEELPAEDTVPEEIAEESEAAEESAEEELPAEDTIPEEMTDGNEAEEEKKRFSEPILPEGSVAATLLSSSSTRTMEDAVLQMNNAISSAQPPEEDEDIIAYEPIRSRGLLKSLFKKNRSKDILPEEEELTEEPDDLTEEDAEAVAESDGEYTEEVVESGEEYAEEVVESAEEYAGEIVEPAEEYIEEAVEPAEEYIEEIVESAEEYAEEVVESAEEYAEEVVESAEEYAEEIVEPAEEFIEESAEEYSEATAEPLYAADREMQEPAPETDMFVKVTSGRSPALDKLFAEDEPDEDSQEPAAKIRKKHGGFFSRLFGRKGKSSGLAGRRTEPDRRRNRIEPEPEEPVDEFDTEEFNDSVPAAEPEAVRNEPAANTEEAAAVTEELKEEAVSVTEELQEQTAEETTAEDLTEVRTEPVFEQEVQEEQPAGITEEAEVPAEQPEEPAAEADMPEEIPVETAAAPEKSDGEAAEIPAETAEIPAETAEEAASGTDILDDEKLTSILKASAAVNTVGSIPTAIGRKPIIQSITAAAAERDKEKKKVLMADIFKHPSEKQKDNHGELDLDSLLNASIKVQKSAPAAPAVTENKELNLDDLLRSSINPTAHKRKGKTEVNLDSLLNKTVKSKPVPAMTKSGELDLDSLLQSSIKSGKAPAAPAASVASAAPAAPAREEHKQLSFEDLFGGKLKNRKQSAGTEAVPPTKKLVLNKKYTLSKEQRRELGEFLLIDGMEEEICTTIEKLVTRKKSGDDTGGHLIVTGDGKTGKTFLTIEILKAVNQEVGHGNPRVAKVQAQAINGKNIKKVLSKVTDSDLIIENIGKLEDDTVRDLISAVRESNAPTMVILEGNALAADMLVQNFPDIGKIFKTRINIGELTLTQWADIAIKYARNQGYRIDGVALLALHAKIDAINTPDMRLGFSQVRRIVDSAIEKAEKRSSGKLFSAFSKKNGNNLIALAEDDFMD